MRGNETDFDEDVYCSVCGERWENHDATGSCPDEFGNNEVEQEGVDDVSLKSERIFDMSESTDA